MSNNVKRAFAILELLAPRSAGLRLHDIADQLDIPVSAAHRHLAELMEMQYVRQGDRQGDSYVATTKLITLGFTVLSGRSIVDLAQPLLDKLAQLSGELVRLALPDQDRLIFVARAQGARGGLLYDGDMGQEAVLFASATGMVWLSQKTDEEAIKLIVAQGLGPPGNFAAKTPQTMQEVLSRIADARHLGYGLAIESANLGTNAIAVPVFDERNAVMGTISIAGPSARLTEARIETLFAPLQAAAKELALARPWAVAMHSGSGWVLNEHPRGDPSEVSHVDSRADFYQGSRDDSPDDSHVASQADSPAPH